jgi:hypothetical protein
MDGWRASKRNGESSDLVFLVMGGNDLKNQEKAGKVERNVAVFLVYGD